MEKAIGKTWELSLYELQRRPQEAVTDETEITINPRTLHSELMCPICLDIMTNTMTTKECLHRFCSECIITALRNGNKECPTCRKKLVSKRSLRHDPNFDALITKIVPSRASQIVMPPPPDKDEESSQLPLSEPHTPMSSTHLQGSEETPSPATSAPTGRGAKRSKSSTPNDSSVTAAPSSRRFTKKETLHQQDNQQVDVVLKSYPTQSSQPSCENIVKFIKIQPEAFVEHLMVYMHLRYTPQPADPTHVVIFGRESDSQNFVKLEKTTTLECVNNRYNNGASKPLELYFKIDSEISGYMQPDQISQSSDKKLQLNIKDEA